MHHREAHRPAPGLGDLQRLQATQREGRSRTGPPSVDGHFHLEDALSLQEIRVDGRPRELWRRRAALVVSRSP